MRRRCALLLFVIALAAHAVAGPPAVPVRNSGLTVTPYVRAPAQLADAALPPGVNLNWDKISIRPLNAKRAQLPLDGPWRFTPAAGGPPPALGWGYIKVPGDWQAHPNGPSNIIMTRASIIESSGGGSRSILAGCPGGPSTA